MKHIQTTRIYQYKLKLIYQHIEIIRIPYLHIAELIFFALILYLHCSSNDDINQLNKM